MLDDISVTTQIGIATVAVLVAFVTMNFLNRFRGAQEVEPKNKDDEIIEATVGKVDEFPVGQMREVNLAEGCPVLVTRDESGFGAIGSKCSHYNVSLKTGTFLSGRVRCSAHGACFNAKTGDIEDYPGCDNIPSYDIRVEGDNVIVKGKAGTYGKKRSPELCKRDPENEEMYVIVGAGAAGWSCAETLRKEGFTGKIRLIGKEEYPPYDRPKLSKSMNGGEFNYDKALIATGGDPRTIPCPGADLDNIFPLRAPQDANNILKFCEGKKVVIVGSSFIGMEVTACIAKKVESITVIGMEKVPFERVLGTEIGAAMQKLHESHNVSFKMERIVSEFKGKDGKVCGVVLDNGEELEAELCVIGAGVIPSTKFIKPSEDVEIFRDQSIVVDKYLKVNQNGLFAAGDIARFPFTMTGTEIRVEHYGNAMYHGKIAALNMLGKDQIVDNIPYFWTSQYGKNIRYAGHAFMYDEVFIDGSLDDLKFAAYYIKDDKILAVAGIGRDQTVAAAAELYAQNKFFSATELKEKIEKDLIDPEFRLK